jgi:tetraacyldisaccharide 4'-kinase
MKLLSVLRWGLWPLSWLYGAVARLRAWSYASGIVRAKRLSTPVVSVGNLTVGGTGKTPMVIWLAERLLAQGKRVGILSRGYKGRGGTSDEIELMKIRLNERAAFGIGSDRYTQGRSLEEKGIDVFLLDDGYQHLELARDVNILLMDAARPVGREQLLPVGGLREPVSAMSRADVLVFTRTAAAPGSEAALAKLHKYPVFSAATRLLGFRRLGGGIQMLSVEEIGAGPFYAFCGIGNPLAFFNDLRDWNIGTTGVAIFLDHHRYGQSEIGDLEKAARRAGARALVTTEKDEQNLVGARFSEMPVFVAVIELSLPREEEFLALIDEKVAARRPSV